MSELDKCILMQHDAIEEKRLFQNSKYNKTVHTASKKEGKGKGKGTKKERKEKKEKEKRRNRTRMFMYMPLCANCSAGYAYFGF